MAARVAQYRLKKSAFAAIGLLILIYALGVFSALFIELPETQRWAAFMTSFVPLSHAVLGTLLIFHSSYLLVEARKARSALWTKVSVLGLIGVLLSVITGFGYISTDNDLHTFLMALGFALSIMAYVYGLYTDQT